MNNKILGIGNALVDILVKVDDEFLVKKNLIKGTMKLINKFEFDDLKNNIKISIAYQVKCVVAIICCFNLISFFIQKNDMRPQ